MILSRELTYTTTGGYVSFLEGSFQKGSAFLGGHFQGSMSNFRCVRIQMSVKKGLFLYTSTPGKAVRWILREDSWFLSPKCVLNVRKSSIHGVHMGHYSKLSAASTGSPLIDDSPSLKAFHKTFGLRLKAEVSFSSFQQNFELKFMCWAMVYHDSSYSGSHDVMSCQTHNKRQQNFNRTFKIIKISVSHTNILSQVVYHINFNNSPYHCPKPLHIDSRRSSSFLKPDWPDFSWSIKKCNMGLTIYMGLTV